MSARRFPPFAVLGLAALLALAATAGLRAGAGQPGNASLSGYFLPGFGPDGYKSWDIQGRDSHATTAENTQAEISDLLLRLYTHEVTPAKATEIKLEMTIKSARATVKTTPGMGQASSTTEVSGAEMLYITGVNDSYTVTGYDWQWNSQKEIINLGRSVVVTFTSAATANTTSATRPAHPIIILSDKLEIKQQPDHNQFTFIGNVSITDKATQADPNGEFHTTCNSLVVIATRASTTDSATPPTAAGTAGLPASLTVGQVESIVAADNVVSRQGAIEAKGGRGELYPSDEKVVMSQSPQVRVALSGNTTETSNYALIEGGIITWQRDKQIMDVVPVADIPGAAGLVKVSLPSNSPPRQGTSEARIDITGESLHAQLSKEQRRIDIEKSVRVEDPRYTVEAQHLNAEFDPPEAKTASVMAVPENRLAPSSSGKTLTVENATPQLGKLKHLTVNGGVTILQTNLQATTPQAEILPDLDVILLSGGPHIVDTLSNATIDSSTIKLATDGNNATVLGEPGKPAHLILPSLPLGENAGPNVETSILSNSVVMERGEKSSSFTFSGNVQVNASSLKMTSGQLDVFTNNLPAMAADTDPTKRIQIMQLVAHDHVLVTQPGFTARAAEAEVNPQAGFTQNTTANSPAAGNKDYRLVQLKGDPKGLTGPVRPEVEVPLQGMTLGAAPGDTAQTPAPTTAKITSDEQWLFTSPTANTYVFSGNITIDGGTFVATCDQMQVNCTQVKVPDTANPNMVVTRLVVDNIVAERNVHIVQGKGGRQVSTGDRAVITPRERKFVLSGNVVVLDNVTGRRLANADIIIDGDNQPQVVAPPATPGQPIQRPHLSLPDSALGLDQLKKAPKKDSNAPAH